MTAEPPVHVLLATRNGERFLDAQLESIRAQDDRDWRLLVHDDASVDRTLAILQRFERDDERVFVLPAVGRRLGSTASFFRLMQHALTEGATYFALCDQDDVWVPRKLSQLRSGMRSLESAYGHAAPLLCWSDLSWIDADGATLADSHFRRAGAQPAFNGPGPWLLAMNVVPGCSMFGNRALLEKALPRPSGIDHHDWWLALVAASVGHVGVVPAVLVNYRQHADNAVGAAPLSVKLAKGLASPAAALARGAATYRQSLTCALRLRERFGSDSMWPDWGRHVAFVIDELGSRSAWRRVFAVLRGPVRRIGWWRNVMMFAVATRSPVGREPTS